MKDTSIIFAIITTTSIATGSEECNFCQDESAVKDPNKVVYEKTCKDWLAMAINNTDPRLCGEYKYIGSKCGCNNSPPDSGCNFCPDGQLTKPKRTLPEFYFTLANMNITVTCEESQQMVQYTFDKDDSVCGVQQSVSASYCGCSNAADMICPICEQGKDGISGEEAPPFTFTTATGSNTTIDDYSCLDAEFVSNMPDLVDTDGCNQIRDQISDVCCVKESVIEGGDMNEEGEDGEDPCPTSVVNLKKCAESSNAIGCNGWWGKWGTQDAWDKVYINVTNCEEASLALCESGAFVGCCEEELGISIQCSNKMRGFGDCPLMTDTSCASDGGGDVEQEEVKVPEEEMETSTSAAYVSSICGSIGIGAASIVYYWM